VHAKNFVVCCAPLFSAAPEEAVQFERGLWRQGDVWIQRSRLTARVSAKVFLSGSELNQIERPIEETDERKVTILEADASGPTEWWIEYFGIRFRAEGTEAAIHVSVDPSLSETGARRLEEVRKSLQSEYAGRGLSHLLSPVLEGRSVRVGDQVDVAPEVASLLLAPASGWSCRSMRLRLRGAAKSQGLNCGEFEVEIVCESDLPSGQGMRAELKGSAQVEAASCALKELSVEGPVSMSLDGAPAPIRVEALARMTFELRSEQKSLRWNGSSSSSWHDAASWSPPQVPDEIDEVALIEREGEVLLEGTVRLDAIAVLAPRAVLRLRTATLEAEALEGFQSAGVLELDPGSRAELIGTFHNLSTGRVLVTRGGAHCTFRTPGSVESIWRNDGEVLVCTGAPFFATLQFRGATVIEGGGFIRLEHSGAVLETAAESSLTQSKEHRICGAGLLRAVLVNYGIVEADVGGGQLRIVSESLVNRGELRARSGGELLFSGGNIDNEGGVIVADGGNVLFASPPPQGEGDETPAVVRIRGGVLSSAPGSLLRVAARGRLVLESERPQEDARPPESVQLRGDLLITEEDATVTVRGSLQNDGTIHVFEKGISSAVLRLEAGDPSGEVRLEGKGGIVLHQEAAARVELADQVRCVQHAPHTISGAGHLLMSLENRGTIRADHPGGLTIHVQEFGLTNLGRIEVISGATLTVKQGELVQLAGVLRVDGTLDLRDSRLSLAGGTLSGTGALMGPVVNSAGTVSLRTTASLRIDGDYAQREDGALLVEIAGNGAESERALLDVSGSALLAGTLEISAESSRPAPGERWVILSARGGIHGRFTELELPEGLAAELEYTDQSLILVIR